MHIRVADKKKAGYPGIFSRRNRLEGNRILISTWYAFCCQKCETGYLAHFFGKTICGFSVAPSEENANLDCYLVDISPRKKPPGAWFVFWRRNRFWAFLRPLGGNQIRISTWCAFRHSRKQRGSGFLLRRNRLFFLTAL